MQANRIGMDAGGDALPNALGGIRIANGLFFGDMADVAENIVSGNNGHGLLLTGTLSHVHDNEITFNMGDGHRRGLEGNPQHDLREQISSNDGLGIDLDDDGVTANDLGDGDGGANFRQNFPVNLQVGADGTTITGTLNSRPNTNYRIELFGNSAGVACDPSGNGEGEEYLTAMDAATDGSGNATFSVPLSKALPAGHFVTATATDGAGSAFPGNTSEFSQCTTPPGEIVVRKGDRARRVICS